MACGHQTTGAGTLDGSAAQTGKLGQHTHAMQLRCATMATQVRWVLARRVPPWLNASDCTALLWWVSLWTTVDERTRCLDVDVFRGRVRQTQSIKQNGAISGFEMCFAIGSILLFCHFAIGSQHLGCLGSQPKYALTSFSAKKFKPHFYL